MRWMMWQAVSVGSYLGVAGQVADADLAQAVEHQPVRRSLDAAPPGAAHGAAAAVPGCGGGRECGARGRPTGGLPRAKRCPPRPRDFAETAHNVLQLICRPCLLSCTTWHQTFHRPRGADRESRCDGGEESATV